MRSVVPPSPLAEIDATKQYWSVEVPLTCGTMGSKSTTGHHLKSLWSGLSDRKPHIVAT